MFYIYNMSKIPVPLKLWRTFWRSITYRWIGQNVQQIKDDSSWWSNFTELPSFLNISNGINKGIPGRNLLNCFIFKELNSKGWKFKQNLACHVCSQKSLFQIYLLNQNWWTLIKTCRFSSILAQENSFKNGVFPSSIKIVPNFKAFDVTNTPISKRKNYFYQLYGSNTWRIYVFLVFS